MRVIHIVPAISEEASGPTYTVVRLCKEVIKQGHEVTLGVLDWAPMASIPKFVKTFPLGFGPRRLGRSPAMARWLVQEVKNGEVEIIHNHGLWMMPNVYPGWAKKAGNVRLVVSPRGTVSLWAWNHHRGRKWVMWHFLGQGRALQAADAFHATSEEEYDDLRRLGFRQPVCVIPNGIDIPPYEKTPKGTRRRLLYLGRIHKKKGIDLLLKAWRAVATKFQEWELIVAGPDDRGYLKKYQKLAGKLKVDRVCFPGPVYGEDKLRMYRSADLYVLPTYSDNFAMTVAEALAAGTPVIATHGAPWKGLIENDAGWWIEIGVQPLIECLQEALALPEERLAEMGRKGREWMARDYSWEHIGQQMVTFYGWLNGCADLPNFVKVNS